MTLLQTFSGKLPTIAEHSKGNIFLEVCVCWSQKVWIAGLQRQRKRFSFAKHQRGLGQKCFEKKPCRVKKGKELLPKTKSVLIKICDISHLLACKLPHKFISWVSRKTKMPNCIVFLQYQSSWRQPWKHLHYQ